MKAHGLDKAIAVPDLNEVITILDPDGLKMASFYVYDSYCQELRDLRAQMRQHPEKQEDLLLECAEIEEGVRRDLSKKLYRFAKPLEEAQVALARIDMNLAKALQMKQLGLCFPTIAKDDTSRFEAMFHPQVKDALEMRKRAFQPVTLTFGLKPTLITGANMGGKTVVLKTLTLCQYLFQYGFGIPAAKADIAVKDEIYFCIGDEQSIEKGLSSFAAEMKNIDAVIKASRENRKIVALIDEPARTTNPTEGTALVLGVGLGEGVEGRQCEPRHDHALRYRADRCPLPPCEGLRERHDELRTRRGARRRSAARGAEHRREFGDR